MPKGHETYWEFKGKIQSIARWAEELGVRRNTLHHRVSKYGYTIEQALSMAPAEFKAVAVAASKAATTTHGHTANSSTPTDPASRTYRSWKSMKQRCLNPASPKYYAYGAKGIRVCARWLDFNNFLADMGVRPEGMSLDRKDNAGDYEPNNCRWSTKREQQNNRSNTIRLTYNGVTKPQAEWAREYGLTTATLKARIKAGWPMERALLQPVQKQNHSK